MADIENISEFFGCPHIISNEIVRLGDSGSLLMPKGIYRLDRAKAEPEAIVAAFGKEKDNKSAMALLDAAKSGVVKSLDHAVYVVATESGAASKIGYTANPTKRLCSLQGANYEKLRISHLFWLPERSAVGVERFALRLAGKIGKRIGGEWVDLPEDEAAFIVATVLTEANVMCSNSAMFAANHKMILEAYSAHDEEWPSNIYRKMNWSEIKRRA